MCIQRTNKRQTWWRTTAFFALVAGLSWIAQAASLDIDLDIRTRAETKGSAARTQRDVVILVLDRSGSMAHPATEVGRPSEMRDTVLREMLRNRLEMLSEARPDAEIWTIAFSSTISKPQGPYSPKDADRIVRRLKEPDGCTLLYDAMARAVEFGEEQMQKDPDARVGVYFYSDGDNYFPRSHWKDPDGSIWNNQVSVRYNGDGAAARFAHDFKDRIQAYADAGKMSFETGCWLGAGAPPAMIENKRKDEYPLELTADGTSLKNPVAEPLQEMKARLLVPLPERYAKELDRLEAALVFEAGKRRSVERFSLAPGKKKVRVNLPDGLPAAAFKGQLRVSALPDAWKSVALAEPEPVELSFAEPGALSLSGMSPRGERWVAMGVPVEFSATATDGAEVTWTIDGKDAGKGTVTKAFDRAGTHRAVAMAQKAGFRPASAECTIHAVDMAVEVVAPAGARVGEKVSFEAKSAGGTNVSWWVDGQPAGGKDARLESWTFDASGHHTAKARVYFGHGLSGEGEAHFEVSVAPNVSIDQPWNGQEFGFGEEIKVGAKVEGDFNRVVWTLHGPEEAANEAEIDRDERRTLPATFKPGKGGDYELSAAAEGAAGRVEAKPIRFTVAREDAWVRIEEPKSGAIIPTGGNTDLRAAAQGEEAKEIRWTVKDSGGKVLFSATRPTEGGVSQCSFAVPETLGNGTTLFVSAEAAGDPALRAENDVETRCANCTAMGAVLSLSHDGDEGRTFGRGEKIVAELKDLRGDVRDIEWTFGEDGRGAGRVVEWNGWTEYNVYPVRATGRCGKCGAAHDFGLESVIVERRPLKASFTISERGSYYTAGGKLHLTSTSEGDIDSTGYVWTVDGVELDDFRGKQEAVVDLPFMACNPVLALTVCNVDGGEEASCERSIRVRFGWVSVVLFLLAALLVWYPLWKLLKDNGPAGWRIVAWKRPAPLPGAKGLEKERKACRNEEPVQCIRKWWSLWKKQAKIPPEELGLDLADMGGVSTDEGKIIVNPTPRKIGGLAELIPDPSADVSLPGIPGVEFYRYYPSYEAQNRCRTRGQTMRCVRILLDTRSRDYRYVTMLWLLSATLLFAVVWASLRYAI